MVANVRPRDRSAIRARGGGSGIVGRASFAPDFFNNPTLVDPKTGLAISLTRATTATFTDQDLIVRTALAGMARMQGMRVVRNLVATTSQAFENAAWTKRAGASYTNDTSVTDPFGGTQTRKLTNVSGAGADGYTYQAYTFVAGNSYVLSVYALAGTIATVNLNAYHGATSQAQIATTAGWRRYSIAFTANSSGAGDFGVGIVTNGGNAGNGYIYTLAIQIEDVTGQSIQTPGEYQSVGVLSTPYQGLGIDGARAYTTLNGNTVASNVVTEATGAVISSAIRQGFLVEAAATNLYLQSQTFDNASWLLANQAAPTANSTVAPDGTTTADTITANASAAFSYVYQVPSLTTATTYTLSAYVKQGTSRYVYLLGETSGDVFAIFDLNTGLFSAYSGTSTGCSNSITAAANGFYRITFTFPKTSGSAAEQVGIGITNSATVPVTSVNGQTAIVWGAQLETGSIATSYIATTTVAVTRNADVASVATGTWFNATLGTLFAQWINTTVSGTYVVASFNDTTTGNVINIQSKTITTCEADVTVATVAQSALSAVSTTSGTVSKAISSYKANSFYGYANNTTLGTDVSGTIPTVTRLELGGEAGATQLNGVLQAFQYYPTVLNTVTAKNMTV